MNSIERGRFERDPSYDPERIEARGAERERNYEKEVDLRPEFEVFRDNERPDGAEDAGDIVQDGTHKIIRLSIPEYTFTNGDNPYRWDAVNPHSLAPIARQLDAMIGRSFAWNDILVRAVQSVTTGMTRGELLTRVRRMGYDRPHTDGAYDFHAAAYRPFGKDASTVQLFEGFHTWKPKCDGHPQYPIDFVMVFDADAYQNVTYLHPRHGTPADDRYILKDGAVRAKALLAIILIN